MGLYGNTIMDTYSRGSSLCLLQQTILTFSRAEDLPSTPIRQNVLEYHPQSDLSELQLSPLQSSPEDPLIYPICDESAVRERWEEVRDFCDNLSMARASMPSRVPPSKPSDYLQYYNVQMRPCTFPSPHVYFSHVKTNPGLSYEAADIDLSEVQQDLRKLAGDDFARLNFVRDFMFPPRRLKDGLFKAWDAPLPTSEISLINPFTFPDNPVLRAAQTAQQSYMSQIPRLRTANTLVSGRTRPSNPPRRSTRPTASQTQPNSSIDPDNLIQQHESFSEMLQPHITYWIFVDNSSDHLTAADYLSTDPEDRRLIGPYLSVTWPQKGESETEHKARATLVATCVLAAQVAAMQAEDNSDQAWKQLRHYVILLGREGTFKVYETAVSTGGKGGYVMLMLDDDSLAGALERLGFWVEKIHSWAIKIFRPMILTECAPDEPASDDYARDAIVNAARVRDLWRHGD
jgi:hypothetical protein